MAQIMFNPEKFTAPKAKPLPIILLLDTSGSMDLVTNPDEVRRTGRYDVVDGNNIEYVEGGITRMDILNKAVRKMLKTFAHYEREATEFLLSIVTFGADTRLVLPPTPASDVRFTDLQPAGETPLKDALLIAKRLVEDRAQIPGRAYRPLVILVSDGQPDAGWEKAFDDFVNNGRSAKCDRMALAISDEADRAMLGKFTEGTGHKLFAADTADEITSFFKFVTMSTVQRTLSRNPDIVPKDADVQAPPPPPKPAQPAPADEDDDDEGYW